MHIIDHVDHTYCSSLYRPNELFLNFAHSYYVSVTNVVSKLVHVDLSPTIGFVKCASLE